MKIVANIIITFVQSGAKKQINKCIVVIFQTNQENKIGFMKDQNSKRFEYQLTNNILDIRTKFIKEGKITVQLKFPNIYILFSETKVTDLEKIVELMDNIRNNRLHQPVSKPTTIITKKDKELIQTTLTIDKVSQFPVRKGYPINVQTLNILNLKLKKFDNRILYLRSLTVLHLEQLLIEELPKDIEKIKLTSLTVTSCKLKKFPNIEPRSLLSQSLCLLDLSDNDLKRLPEDLWFSFSFLRSISLSDNFLEALPSIGLENLKSLRKFDLSNNSLSILPFSFSVIASSVTQCNLSSAFSLRSSRLLHNELIRRHPFQPQRLSEMSMLSLLNILPWFPNGLMCLKNVMPESLWLQLSVFRRCYKCRTRVGRMSSRGWADLKSIANVSFSVNTNEANPILIYCCEKCLLVPLNIDN